MWPKITFLNPGKLNFGGFLVWYKIILKAGTIWSQIANCHVYGDVTFSVGWMEVDWYNVQKLHWKESKHMKYEDGVAM